MEIAATPWIHALWVLPLFLLIAYLASPRFRGDIAETRVRRLLRAQLEKSRYTVFNDLLLARSGGTISIDHVVVSRFGIFVIESAAMRGSISGTAVQDRWKQYRLGGFRYCGNPVHRNALQLEALQDLLQLPSSRFHRVVVLAGHKGFKSAKPEGVIRPDELLRTIRSKNDPLLSPETAAGVVKTLHEAKLSRPGGLWLSPSLMLRLALAVLMTVGLYYAFRDELSHLRGDWRLRLEMMANPEHFGPDGRRKTDRELWADSLVCAASPDTGRCACYQPDGTRVELETAACRALAERGALPQPRD